MIPRFTAPCQRIWNACRQIPWRTKRTRGQFAYRIYVRTRNAYLETRDGKRHPILPGMIATMEIRTGRKTVMDYVLRPLNKASEAIRER